MKKNKLLVTGVAGYIGSTFTYEALKKGYKIIGIDNFSNSRDAIVKYFLSRNLNILIILKIYTKLFIYKYLTLYAFKFLPNN